MITIRCCATCGNYEDEYCKWAECSTPKGDWCPKWTKMEKEDDEHDE